MNDVGNGAMRYGSERVFGKNAPGHLHSVDVMNAFPGGAAVFWKSRNERQALEIHGLQQALQLSADVAPQSRVGFFVKAPETILLRVTRHLGDDVPGFFRRKVP
jgi:hypothetical protein